MDDFREKSQRKILDSIQQSFERHITNWDLLETEDIFHEETDSVIRSFTFSRGKMECLVLISPRFYIAGASKKTDINLLTQIFNILNSLLWKYINGGLAVYPPKLKRVCIDKSTNHQCSDCF